MSRWSVVVSVALWFAAGSALADSACRVDVSLRESPGLVADVAMVCPATDRINFSADNPRLARLMSAVRDSYDGEALSGGRFDVPARRGMASIQYSIDIDAALNEGERISFGVRVGRSRLLLLEAWLVQPRNAGVPLDLAIAVQAPPEINFAVGLPLRDGRYRLIDAPVRFAGYSVMGRFELRELRVPGIGAGRDGASSSRPEESTIRLALLDGQFAVDPARLGEWVRRTSLGVSEYFQGYTAPEALIALVPVPGAAVSYGRVVPGGGITMVVQVGQQASARTLYEDWILTHETIHTGTPFVYGRGTWIMEGLATYIEPIIRARIGWKSEDDVWREWLTNMRRGLFALTENGLIASSGGGANYWGGALFMLMADLQMREFSAGRYGLEDCLRGLLHEGNNATQRWSVTEFIDGCDRATGGTVMADLAARYAFAGSPLDLDDLWRRLGVRLDANQVVYDDTAPLAAMRKLIMMGDPRRPARSIARE